jgi:hypothetical protein
MAEMLTNEELGGAIEAGFKRPGESKGKVDVLLMMNCLMMNVHACYALRESVQYLVAPQGGIDEPGYNYKAVLNRIMQPGGGPASARDIAELCVESTFDFADVPRKDYQNIIQRWAIFAFDLSRFDSVAARIDALADYLNQNWAELEAPVHNARDICFRFDDVDRLPFNLVDFMHFVRLLLEQSNGLTAHQAAITGHLNEILNERNLLKVKEKEIQGEIYNQTWRRNLRADLDASGLGIFFPVPLDKTSPYYKFFIAENAPEASRFFRDNSNWTTLLGRMNG